MLSKLQLITILLRASLILNVISAEPFTVFETVRQAYKTIGSDLKHPRIIRSNNILLSDYDFIIVGAGPAGATLARRLTEIPFWNVLLIEAGVDGNAVTDIPILNTYLWFSEYNQLYRTEPTNGACLGLNDEICPWPNGKGMGGGTLINAMIYTRGNKRDFDEWAAMGNEGWSYDDVLPYFKKSEQIGIPELMDSPYHSKEGFLKVQYTTFRTPLLELFLNAGKELGYKIVDYNNPNSHVGFSPIQGTVDNGKRVSADTAALKDIKSRKNLHISKNSQVLKILINPDTKRAYGVQFVKRGRKKTILARKEVILSAGAFNSAQLLMLSGIGHKEHLNDLGIPVIQDLSVGDNLQEHLSMAALAFLIDEDVSINPGRIAMYSPALLYRYLHNGKTVLSHFGCEGLGYVKTKYANQGDDVPDIEFIFVAASLASDGGVSLRKTMAISDYVYESVFGSISKRSSWTIWPMQLYPYSRGTVRLHSRSPFSQPKINTGFLDDKRDLDIIVEGLKMAVNVSRTSSFQAIGSRLHRTPIPQCAEFEFGSDEYWACSVRHITTQFHHQSGTCKMGPSWDKDAVVNPQLQVYGVNGLRVIDCSIMPKIPGSHTMAAAYMIGEKGADLIKEFWLKG